MAAPRPPIGWLKPVEPPPSITVNVEPEPAEVDRLVDERLPELGIPVKPKAGL